MFNAKTAEAAKHAKKGGKEIGLRRVGVSSGAEKPANGEAGGATLSLRSNAATRRAESAGGGAGSRA